MTPNVASWAICGTEHCQTWVSRKTRQSWTVDSTPGVAIWGVIHAFVGLQLIVLFIVYSQAQGCACATLRCNVVAALAYVQI